MQCPDEVNISFFTNVVSQRSEDFKFKYSHFKGRKLDCELTEPITPYWDQLVPL